MPDPMPVARIKFALIIVQVACKSISTGALISKFFHHWIVWRLLPYFQPLPDEIICRAQRLDIVSIIRQRDDRSACLLFKLRTITLNVSSKLQHSLGCEIQRFPLEERTYCINAFQAFKWIFLLKNCSQILYGDVPFFRIFHEIFAPLSLTSASLDEVYLAFVRFMRNERIEKPRHIIFHKSIGLQMSKTTSLLALKSLAASILA